MSDLPSIEAIEYGRLVITNEVARLRKFERDADARGDEAASERWRKMARWLEWQLVGDGTGCVIRPFDPRKADPEWRAWYTNDMSLVIDGGTDG